jgi:hypothetical protein
MLYSMLPTSNLSKFVINVTNSVISKGKYEQTGFVVWPSSFIIIECFLSMYQGFYFLPNVMCISKQPQYLGMCLILIYLTN